MYFPFCSCLKLYVYLIKKYIFFAYSGFFGFSGRVCNFSGSGRVGFVIFFSGSGRVRVSKKPSGRVGFSGFRVPDPSLLWQLLCHSLHFEIVWLLKSSSKRFQNLSYFWNLFSISCFIPNTLLFTLMNALVYVIGHSMEHLVLSKPSNCMECGDVVLSSLWTLLSSIHVLVICTVVCVIS